MRLLRGLGGRPLICGCLVGVYETYSGRVVSIIDARGASCANPQHALHAMLPAWQNASVTPPASDDRSNRIPS